MSVVRPEHVTSATRGVPLKSSTVTVLPANGIHAPDIPSTGASGIGRITLFVSG